MDIRIKSVSMTNFKRFNNLIVDLQGKDVSVYGDNATGKTSIADAITWVLFDKNNRGESSFQVKPEGVERPEVVVELILDVNGEETKLKKKLVEKWTKRRGDETETFTGHVTSYWVNEIPQNTVSDYKSYLDSIIDEATFKRLTSADYFLSKKKPEMRTILIDMAGDVSNEDVQTVNPDLAPIIKVLTEQKRSVDDLLKLVKQNVTTYNAEQDQINPRIDEVKRMIPAETDWGRLEGALAKGEEYLREINSRLSTVTQGASTAIQRETRVKELKATLQSLENTAKITANNEHSTAMSTMRFMEQHHAELERNHQSLIRHSAELKDEEVQLHAKLVGLKEKYKEQFSLVQSIKSEEFVPLTADQLICNACGQKLPAGKIEDSNAKAFEVFNKSKVNRLVEAQRTLEDIGKSGISNKEYYNTVISRQEKNNADLSKLDAEMTIAFETVKELKAKADSLVVVDVIDMSNNGEYQNILRQIAETEAEVDEVQADTTPLLAQKAKLESQIMDAKTALARRGQIKELNDRVEGLVARGKELAGLIAREKANQYACEKFIQAKAKMLGDKINSMFDNIQFRLFETQINGGIADDCTPLVNGIEYKDASNSERIRANMDLIKAFQKSADTTVFCLVDNAEAATYLRKMDCQVIRLVVSEQDKGLRVVLEDESPKVIHFEEDGEGGFVSTETVKTINPNDQLDIENLFSGF